MSEPAREIPVSAARERLADVVNSVVYGGSITYLTRHGRRLAAIVSAQIAEDIERQRRLDTGGSGATAVSRSRRTGLPVIRVGKIVTSDDVRGLEDDEA